MRILRTLLAGCLTSALLAGCGGAGGGGGADSAGGGDGAGGAKGTPRPEPSHSAGKVLHWSSPHNGPERPAHGKAATTARARKANRDGGDLNGDGYDDFVAYAKDRIRVLYGSPGGLDARTRTTVLAGPGEGAPHTEYVRFVRADLDHDGYTDVVANFRDAGGMALALWSGPRGVERVTALPGRGVVRSGDFDGDGAADVFRLNSGGTFAGTVLYGPLGRDGRAGRQRALKQALPRDSAPHGATTGDFDGDGRADLAVRMEWTDPASEGDGDLTYQGMHYYRGTAEGLAYDARLSGDDAHRAHGTPADVNGDGKDDATQVYFHGDGQALHLTTRPGGDPGAPAVTLTGLPGLGDHLDDFGGTSDPGIGDVTGDGRADLVVGGEGANHNQGVIFLLRDVARPRTRHVQAVDLRSPGVPGPDRPRSANRFAPMPPLLDVNGDGYQDAVASTRRGDGYWTLPGSDAGLDTRAASRIPRDELD